MKRSCFLALFALSLATFFIGGTVFSLETASAQGPAISHPFPPACDPVLPPKVQIGDRIEVPASGGRVITIRATLPGCGIPEFLTLIRNFIVWGTYILFPIGVILIIYAGFVIMTAAGSVERVKTGYKIMRITLTGIVIAFAAWLIINFVFLAFTGRGVAGFFLEQAYAQGQNDPPGLPNPLGTTSFWELMNRVADYAFTLSIPLATLMVIVGGYLILFSAGDPEKFQKGTKTIMYTLIAFLFILTSKGIIFVFQSILSGP